MKESVSKCWRSFMSEQAERNCSFSEWQPLFSLVQKWSLTMRVKMCCFPHKHTSQGRFSPESQFQDAFLSNEARSSFCPRGSGKTCPSKTKSSLGTWKVRHIVESFMRLGEPRLLPGSDTTAAEITASSLNGCWPCLPGEGTFGWKRQAIPAEHSRKPCQQPLKELRAARLLIAP